MPDKGRSSQALVEDAPRAALISQELSWRLHIEALVDVFGIYWVLR